MATAVRVPIQAARYPMAGFATLLWLGADLAPTAQVTILAPLAPRDDDAPARPEGASHGHQTARRRAPASASGLITLSDARLRLAMRCLDQIVLPLPYSSPFVETSPRLAYRMQVDHLVNASSILGPAARQALRTAYRWGGIRSPSLASIAGRFRTLVELYLARRRATFDG